MAPVTTMKGAVEPILWLNRIFGMGIFEIPANRPRVVLSVIYVISTFIGYYILLYETLYIYVHSKIKEVFLIFCVLGVNTFVANMAIILYWCKSKNLLIIIKKIGHADDTLGTLGVHHNYKKIFRSVANLLIYFVLVMLLLNLMDILWTYNKIDNLELLILADLCFCLPIMVNFVVDVTFMSFILCLKKKFQYTNYLVNNVVLCANESNVFKTSHDKRENTPVGIRAQYGNNKNEIMHFVQTLRQVHLELTKIARKVNSTFCLQLLLELAVHFTVITTSVYNLYAIFSGKTHRPPLEDIISTILWGSIYAIKVILVNNLCTETSEEAYKTGEIIQSFVGSAIDDDVREEINQFTQQIMLTSLKFTAFGFFRIDNTFTGKFFATVTKYVVILIQMNTPI